MLFVGRSCHSPVDIASGVSALSRGRMSSPSPVIIPLAFEAFREHLDEHYDRRERLIKVCFVFPFPRLYVHHGRFFFLYIQASRDISAASKKVIFLIHRLLNEASSGDRALSHHAGAEARRKLNEVCLMMKNVAHELDGSRFWRYAHNVSGGLQEYIEALSFLHYVECGGLVSYEQVQANLSDDGGQPVRTRVANTP